MFGPALFFMGVGVLLVGLAIPLIQRRVRPNALYGLRVPATLADEWVWYEANARTGRNLLRLGLLMIVAPGPLRVLTRTSDPSYSLAMAALLLVGVIALAAHGWHTANRLLADRRSGRQG